MLDENQTPYQNPDSEQLPKEPRRPGFGGLKDRGRDLGNSAWLKQFRDVRAIGLLAFLVVALMVSWSGAKVIQTNYDLQKQISELQQENQVQALANNNLKLENQYFNTDQYLELKARQDFGLGARGEKLVIVPRDVALAHTVDDVNKSAVPTAASKKPQYQKNFEAWVGFFLHRQQAVDQ